MRTEAGEGPTAKEALEALAFSLRDDETPCVIRLRAATIPAFGRQPAYEGFVAEIDHAPAEPLSHGS